MIIYTETCLQTHNGVYMDNNKEDSAKHVKPQELPLPSEEDSQVKVDVKKLVAVVPPPAILFAKERKGIKEKRVRLLYDSSLNKDEAKISKALAKELNVKEYIEITVAGRKKFRFKAIVVDANEPDVVYVSPETMKAHGIADKSICTIRGV